MKKGGRKHLNEAHTTWKGPGSQHCSDLSFIAFLSRLQR